MTVRPKVAAITGAAGGLGTALARRFAQDGYRIVAIDRDRGGLDRLAGLLPIAALACDLTDEAECRRAAEAAGPIDLLINNAGITHFSRFDATTAATFRKVMEVNFQGAVNATSAFLPGLRERKGAIVAIASVAGFAPLYGRSAYAASKHAMLGFFATLATELADDGVHVMIACPSFIATQETTRASGAADRADGTARPGSAGQTAGRPLSPDDVAAAIARGLLSRKRLLPIGRLAWLSYWISRLAPAIYEKAMLRQTRSEIG